ncbi:DUF6404 family protein [Xenorhabdus lircayensis]
MSSSGIFSTDFLLKGIVAGIAFGLMFTLFHLYRRKSNKLPDWKSL